jgi:hypothetical protein
MSDALARGTNGRFILNARVKAVPDSLAHAVTEALMDVKASIGLKVSFDNLECFSPKPPRPAYRLNRYGASVSLEQSDPLVATPRTRPVG